MNLILIFLLAITLIFVSASMGYIKVPVEDVARIVLYKITGSKKFISQMNHIFPYVIWDVRLPRIITSAIVGAGLSVSGCIFQAILLNPLADPYTLGISAGAAFGASIALLFDIRLFGIYSVELFAFLGAVSTLFLVIGISSSTGSLSSHTLILSGIIVSAILSAAISFIKYIAGERVSVIVFWLMGSFVARTWSDAISAFLFVFFGFLVALLFSRDLNAMSFGDRIAISVGVDVAKVRLLLLVVSSLIAAACVSVSGIIGFVGLVIPHLVRLILGSDARVLIPASFFLGSALLLFADTITRVFLPVEIPIGVLTAIIGGPFFCYIFVKRYQVR